MIINKKYNNNRLVAVYEKRKESERLSLIILHQRVSLNEENKYKKNILNDGEKN